VSGWYGLYELISHFQSLYVNKQLLRLLKLGDREMLLHTEHGSDIRNKNALWMNRMTLIKCLSTWIKSRHTCIHIYVQSIHPVHIAGRRDEILDQLLFPPSIFFLPKKNAKDVNLKSKTRTRADHQ